MDLQILLITLVYAIITVTCISEERPRLVQFVSDNGDLQWVNLDESSTSNQKYDPDEDIEYWLYTKKNPFKGQRLYKGGNEGLFDTFFNVRKAVKLTVHGWKGDLNSSVNTAVAAAFLQAMDVNMIAVDWSKGSSGGYAASIQNQSKTGASIGGFIDWLVSLGVSLRNIHIIGHSLGGQLVGFIGRSVKSGMVSYITGLDPANPSWGPASERLRPSDAKYVEVIHTNCGQLGVRDPMGHNDFYPNGGVTMSGCEGVESVACSHSRAWAYFADSIDHDGFQAKNCASVDEALASNCTGLVALHMGGARTKPPFGIFSLETNAGQPYYKL